MAVFNLLTDDLPVAIEIDSYVYAINTGFKAIIKAVAAIDDIGQPPKKETDITAVAGYYTKLNQSIDKFLHLIYGQKTHNPVKAFEKAVEFIQFDKDESRVEDEKNENSFDFAADAKYIYSAFLQQYAVDLTVTDLHWWKFKALLQSLKECKLTDIIYYRTADLSECKGKELERMVRLKDMYSLNKDKQPRKNPSEILREFLERSK